MGLSERIAGREAAGIVTLRDFDRGVATTLGGKIEDGHYILSIPGVSGPPGYNGVPVFLSVPEQLFEKKRLPCLVIQRDSLSPAMSRWQSIGHEQYNAPAPGANPLTVTAPDGSVLSGYDSMEVMKQAMPYDIGYTISIYAPGREANERLSANKILDYVLRVYLPYSLVYVKDSIDDTRSYQAYMEGVAMLDDILSVNDRVIGFAVTLRVEGELDNLYAEKFKTVTSGISLTITPKKV